MSIKCGVIERWVCGVQSQEFVHSTKECKHVERSSSIRSGHDQQKGREKAISVDASQAFEESRTCIYHCIFWKVMHPEHGVWMNLVRSFNVKNFQRNDKFGKFFTRWIAEAQKSKENFGTSKGFSLWKIDQIFCCFEYYLHLRILASSFKHHVKDA